MRPEENHSLVSGVPTPAKATRCSTKQDRNLLILQGDDVASILAGRDLEVIRLVEEAYKAHTRGETSLPHSSFVSLPGTGNRIIALPAFIGGTTPAAGMKWIASIPSNPEAGRDRASAVIVINDPFTGHLRAVLDGSLISRRRTAASAILAVQRITSDVDRMALVGCGPINFEIARVAALVCHVKRFVLFDIRSERAAVLASRLSGVETTEDVCVASTLEEACRSSPLVSIATTATLPYINEIRAFQSRALILHISLRDLSPSVIVRCDNITDDIDHVCRANTSLEMTESLVGNRGFLRCSLGEILSGRANARPDSAMPIVFSPFGLGILDVAVARFVVDQALERGLGTHVSGFMSAAGFD
jgi:2,3-diaminopropionate biosynthesis protein SbnB